MFPLHEGSLLKLFGILLKGRFFSSPIYLIIYLKREYWFYTLGYNPVPLYFFAHVVPALAIGSSFGRLLYPFDVPPLLHGLGGGLFIHLSNFLFFGPSRYSRLIPGLCLSPWISHFSKEPWFLLLENGIKNQDLGSRCAHCHWVPFGF